MKNENLSCPLPIMDHTTIQLSHGAGGQLSADLIDKIFLPQFTNEILNRMDDQAVIDLPVGRLAFTTDSFVVDPIFFPGGDIGELAVCGTVNDLSMSGGTPLYLSAAFIIEEGFPMEDLHRIVLSMKASAKRAGVQIVTGDTKVVDKGSCDKIFINTSGIGIIPADIQISGSCLSVGDKIILSGTIAEHGMAVLISRNGLSFESQITSDTAPLNSLVQAMLKASPNIHALRDPTRGGVATTLNEFARQSQVGVQLYQNAIPVRAEVEGACEILGVDPMYVANEGKLIAVIPNNVAQRVLEAMREHELGKDAAIIGEVVSDHPAMVVMKTTLGVNRVVSVAVGEQLPRIC